MYGSVRNRDITNQEAISAEGILWRAVLALESCLVGWDGLRTSSTAVERHSGIQSVEYDRMG
jgi:hypothetical protein